MKKILILLIMLSVWPVFAEDINVSDLKFYVELKGNLSNFKNGHFGVVPEGAEGVKDKKRGNYSVEAGLSLGKYSFSLEAGFFSREISSDTIGGAGAAHEPYAFDSSYKNTFFMLNNKVRFIELDKIRVYGKFGVGLFIGKFKFNEALDFTGSDEGDRIQSFDAKKAAPGFQLGLSADMELNSRFSVVAELQYRVVRLGEIEGNMDYNGSKAKGDIWHLKDKNSDRQIYWIGDWSKDYYSGSKAVFKINGLILNLGIRIYL